VGGAFDLKKRRECMPRYAVIRTIRSVYEVSADSNENAIEKVHAGAAGIPFTENTLYEEALSLKDYCTQIGKVQ
jgi:hypothetical protein